MRAVKVSLFPKNKYRRKWQKVTLAPFQKSNGKNRNIKEKKERTINTLI